LWVIQTAAFLRWTGVESIAFVLDDGLGVAAVVFDVVKGEATDGPLHLEQVLELEGDAIGLPDDQHIIRNASSWIDLRGEGDAAVLDPVVGGLARANAGIRAFEDLEKVVVSNLLVAKVDERLKLRLDGWVGVRGEENAPAGLAKVVGIADARVSGKVRVVDTALVRTRQIAGDVRKTFGRKHGRWRAGFRL